jgi:hypothetical protein
MIDGASQAKPTQDESVQLSTRRHRRQTLRGIILPVGLAFVILLMIAGLMFSMTASQISMVSDVMVTLFVLVPMTLCLLPVYILLIIAAFGMGAANKASARQLRRLHRLSYNIAEKTIQITGTVDKRTLEARVKLAGAEAFMDKAFKAEGDDNDGNDNRTTNPDTTT